MIGQNTINNLRIVVFRIESEYYGLDISFVNEIVKLQSITQIPDTKEYINGVMNLRGKIVPVVSLKKRFLGEDNGYDKKARIVVVSIDDYEVGILVDEVYKVISVLNEDVEAASEEMVGRGEQLFNYVLKSEEGIIGILNIQIVLGNTEA